MARRTSPAKLLLEQTEGLFDLLPMGIICFDFTYSECPVVCSPVAAAVVDYRRGISLRLVILPAHGHSDGAMVSGGTDSTKLAVTLEPHHIVPSPAVEIDS